MFEPISYQTGPDCGCAPRFFFITKDVSNIFSNNIEGRLNCKREFVVDPALRRTTRTNNDAEVCFSLISPFIKSVIFPSKLVKVTLPHIFARHGRDITHLKHKTVLDRFLMIGWRKKSWNPERVPSVDTLCVCLCVCPSVNGLQATLFPFDLGTQLLGWVILRTWEKNAFFCFSKFSFLRFL